MSLRMQFLGSLFVSFLMSHLLSLFKSLFMSFLVSCVMFRVSCVWCQLSVVTFQLTENSLRRFKVTPKYTHCTILILRCQETCDLLLVTGDWWLLKALSRDLINHLGKVWRRKKPLNLWPQSNPTSTPNPYLWPPFFFGGGDCFFHS